MADVPTSKLLKPGEASKTRNVTRANSETFELEVWGGGKGKRLVVLEQPRHSKANFFLAFGKMEPLSSLFRPSFSVKPRIADPLCERKSALESRLVLEVSGHDVLFCSIRLS